MSKKPAVPTTADQVLAAVAKNHIWLNAMKCFDPTPEFCEGLGREILDMLRRENLLPKYCPNLDNETPAVREALVDMASVTPVLYLSINKS